MGRQHIATLVHQISMPYFLYYLYSLPMLPVFDYLLLCCVDFENKISIYLSVTTEA